MLNKLLIIISLFLYSIDAREVSAFGAGDISSPTPYGLTSAEKHILNNKNKLDKFDTNVKGVKNSVGMVSERIDGLESIIEGDSKKLHDTFNNLNKLLVQYDLDIQRMDKSDQNIKLVIEKLLEDQLLLIQNQESFKQDLLSLKKSQDNLTKVVNKINSVYISSNELKSNMSQFVTKKEFDKLITLLDKKNKKVEKNSKSKKQMMKEAKELFDKEYFTKAIPIYENLVKLNYKPAESNFMLGQMWFVREEYKKAISYFKSSGILYDKGWWMPDLLLNSAISFEKIGDIDNAASFYSSLLEIYPETKQAKIAQKNILK